MAYRYLNWDSAFFGKRIYQLDTFRDLYLDEWESVLSEKPDLVYCVIEAPSSETVEFIESQGGNLYDRKIRYFKREIPADPITDNAFYSESTSQLTDDLETMTYQSGSFSRFRLDPQLSFKFKDLYKEWIVNSLNRKLADEVLLAKDHEGKTAGFITLSVKDGTGNIGLLAVHENFRGRGAGMFLMRQADKFFKEKQASGATVVTQLDNIPACRLYEKMGYAIEKNESIFHYYSKK